MAEPQSERLSEQPRSKLFVMIVCRDCRAQRQLTVDGPWDLEDVRYDCSAVQSFKVIRRQ